MEASHLIEMLGYAILGSLLAVPLILLNLKHAVQWGFVDWPKARGVSQDQVPIIGYSIVFLTLMAMVTIATVYGFSPWLLSTAAIVAVMGHLDDRRPLPPVEKLFWQLLCVGCVVHFDPSIYANFGAKYGIWGELVAAMFLLGLVNAINFIDGIDGLAGTVLLVATVGLLLFSYDVSSQYSTYLLAGIIGGTLLPFMFFNVLKRRGFLGNTGSYFFGYLLGALHLSVPLNSTDLIARISVNALCFLVPIADSITVVVTRLCSVRSPLQGDKGHLHHRLVQTSLPLRFILLNFALVGLAGISIAYLLNIKSYMYHSRLPVVICFGYLGVVSLLIGMIEKASKRRIQSYFLRFDRNEPVFFLKYKLASQDGSPVSAVSLRRIEARISTEIRVSDVCFAEPPDKMYVIVSVLGEPVRSIQSRIEAVINLERLNATLIVDQGEYVKLSYAQSPSHELRKAS